MALKATISNSDKGLLPNVKRFPCVLKVLLHLQRKNVKCSHRRRIARLQIILTSNFRNYQMASTVIIS